jgi:predicted lipid-binding transport protein (Tim44 family)
MRRFLIAIICLFVALAPGLALARAGNSTSMGSRGSMTLSAPAPTQTAPLGATPMQQSIKPYGASAPSYGTSRPSFMGAVMGGLLGAGLIGLLLGGGLFHGGLGVGGFIGLMLQLWLLYWAARFVFRLVTAGSPGAGLAGGMPPQAAPHPGPAHGLAIGPEDYHAFEQTLYAVQQAWTQHDIATLRLIATPEMVSYFGDQLAEQTSQGVRNVVADVHLDHGDLSEAWSEEGRDYATVSMRFSMTDVTYDAAGRVVSGMPGQRVQAVEFWTFLRVPGGRWLLSAIQQAR